MGSAPAPPPTPLRGGGGGGSYSVLLHHRRRLLLRRAQPGSTRKTKLKHLLLMDDEEEEEEEKTRQLLQLEVSELEGVLDREKRLGRILRHCSLHAPAAGGRRCRHYRCCLSAMLPAKPAFSYQISHLHQYGLLTLLSTPWRRRWRTCARGSTGSATGTTTAFFSSSGRPGCSRIAAFPDSMAAMSSSSPKGYFLVPATTTTTPEISSVRARPLLEDCLSLNKEMKW